MSSRKRRPRSGGGVAVAHQAPAPGQPVAARNVVPMPKWQWRTFPVYFAFAIGGFIGLYMGLIAGATANGTVQAAFCGFWAILLGFGFSRVTSAWLLSRGWARQIGKKR